MFNRLSTYYKNQFIITLSTILLFTLILALNTNAQSVSVGKGSYSTTLPAGEVGPQNFSGMNVTPKVASTFNQPVQTNDYWSSLIYSFFGSPYSNILYAHPLNFKAVSNGLEVGYTSDYIFAANDFLYPYSKQLTVGVDGLSAAKTETKSYGDWTVTASWESGEKSMEATIGHGLPYAFFKISGGDAVITTESAPDIWFNKDEVLGISVAGKHYGLFAPTGSIWSVTSILKSSLNGKDYLSIALLPDTSVETLELFRKHAYAFVINSKTEWNYDESTANITATYSYETQLKDDAQSNVNETLTALYRHQWLNTSASLTSFSYQSPRGEMKLLEGNTFSTELKFSGILPALPDRGEYNKTILLDYIKEVASESIPVGPTYENGKLMARFSNLVYIADQLGAIAERDYFLSEIKNRLEDWFTVGGAQEYYYNNTWNVLTGYPSGYGADNQINDHHFHASYAVMCAATIARYDSLWAAQDNWGGMVNLLIKDANNWDRTDKDYPFLRTFDTYAGHSWASGHGDFAEGNNQESSSESMNFASAAFLWGEATNQTEIRDLGIYLYTTEKTAVEQYWFDIDNEVFPQDYPHVAIGMVWGGKGVHSTWFGADPEFIHGINILPITSASLYLGHHPDYVLLNYNEVVSERNGQPNIWKDILWEYLALSDASLALSYYYADASYTPFDGESRAHTYHWLYNLKKMGHVETSITADIPTYSVFKDASNELTYIAYNAGSTQRLVTFSDGYSMTVLPKELKSFSTAIEDPNAPVAILLSDKTSGKSPLAINFKGSNSFDPNGSELSYLWDFGDGETLHAIDTSHVFKEVGTYNVILTVTNKLQISSKDSILISVLGNGTPYFGIPFAVPGKIEAEFYDNGGEGIAFHDKDAVNKGVPFRSNEGVDIEASNDIGGGYDIGWIEDGEWVEYTINVAEDGIYTVIPVIASVPGGGSLHIEFNGVNLTGKRSVPVTGGWQFWQEIPIPDIELKAGKQIMHVAFYGGEFNLNWIEIKKSSATSVNNSSNLPIKYELAQNYPNPFNPTTTISYSIPHNGLVQLKIFDVLGNEVISLVNKEQMRGNHKIVFNAYNLSSGIYFYRLHSGGYIETKKFILLK